MPAFLFTVLAAGSLFSSAFPVAAAEVEADLKGFCREKYGHDAFPGVDQRDNGLLCSRPTAGGLGLLHRKIKPADVCAAQHGTRRYRREGKKLICLTAAGGKAERAGKVIDLEKHCKAAYGPNAKVTRRLTDDRPMCTVPSHGGFGLTHHLIDPAELCGGPPQKVEGNTVHCRGAPSAKAPPSKKETAGPPKPRQEGARVPGEGEAPAGKPEPTDEAEVAMQPAKGTLEGCAIFAGGIPFWELIGSDQASIVQGRVPFPCPGLSGGWEADDLCGFRRTGMQGKIEWQNGRPICRFLGPKGQADTGPSLLTAVCAIRFRELTGKNLYAVREDPMGPPPAEGGFAKQTGNVLAFRWHDRKLHCFLVPQKTVNCYGAFLAKGSYPPGCLAIEPREILFVQAEPPYDTIEALTIGTSFRVKLVFDTDPGQTTAPVTVTNERTGKTIELVAEQTDDPTIFRTPPVNLLPEVTP